MATQTELFADLRPANRPRPRARKPPPVNIEAPLWTIDKSRLIDEYLHHFLMVTKHGVYLDLFAGPQHTTDTENWSVRRVLQRRTEGNPSIRHYAVCDIKRQQANRLRRLGKDHPSFCVYEGDANERVHEMLRDAPITSKTACFCLIDQRTFECHWTTVEAIAQYKREGYKIELFYFLAQNGWTALGPARETRRSSRRGGVTRTTSTSECFPPSHVRSSYAIAFVMNWATPMRFHSPFTKRERGHGPCIT